LLRNLGVEGRAVVWEAHDITLDRRVRVKLLRADLGGDARAIEHFRDEVRAAARGGTADTDARVLDAGDDQSLKLPFVVFEWLDQLADQADDNRSTEPEWLAAPPARAKIAPVTPARAKIAQVERSGGGSPGRLAQRLVLLLVLIPIAVGAFLVRNFLQQPAPVPNAVFSLTSGTSVATPGASTVPASRAAAPVAAQPTSPPPTAVPATPRPTLTPAPASGQRRRIANTDGQGVALRATAGGDKLPGKGYDEGVTVTLLEVQGDYAHIRGDDGREGWVLAVTLVP
jgi:hypothetical protein